MKFTGERAIPKEQASDDTIIIQHTERYRVASNVCKNKVVLDLACGSGFGCEILATTAKKVYGFDISQEAIDYAKENYPSAEYGICDLEKDFPCVEHDIVICFETLEHLSNPANLINSVKKDFIFSIPINNPGAFHKVVYSDDDVKDLMKNFNLYWYQQELDGSIIKWSDGARFIIGSTIPLL